MWRRQLGHRRAQAQLLLQLLELVVRAPVAPLVRIRHGQLNAGAAQVHVVRAASTVGLVAIAAPLWQQWWWRLASLSFHGGQRLGRIASKGRRQRSRGAQATSGVERLHAHGAVLWRTLEAPQREAGRVLHQQSQLPGRQCIPVAVASCCQNVAVKVIDDVLIMIIIIIIITVIIVTTIVTTVIIDSELSLVDLV